MIFSTWVSGWARIKPAAVAVKSQDRILTWQELDQRASQIAHALVSLGISPGDRVACLLNNRVEYFEILTGVTRMGAIFVPLNAMATAPELTNVVNDCGARVIFSDATFSGVLGPLLEATQTTIVDVGGTLDSAHHNLDDLGHLASTLFDPVARDFDDPVCIYYTSGTTGLPKGAVISNGNIHYATLNWLVDLGFSQDDRFLLNLPMCFTGAMAIAAPALHGGITTILERSFDAARTLELIEVERTTFMVAVPTMALAMMRHPDFATRDLSSMRMVLCGAAPVPMSVFQTWTQRGVAFISSFGMTEVAGGFAMVTPVDQAAQRLGSAGRACLYTEAMIQGEDGSKAPADEVGELLIRGPLVFKGYWNNPSETRSAVVDGWLHTGDLARCDSDGFFEVVDRKKDVVISGALNIYPAEVERALIALPGVLDCAVFGLPHETWGEELNVAVVRSPEVELSDDDVITFCRANLASYKVPKRVHFRTALPRTTSGKVKKRALREEISAALG
ncbi:AMP-binding protein [Williamsia muralis]|uniref:AMP-binding protein n=1 Tax=Williamsia marianensis TaxID=85044 RepID=UPI000DE613D3|nr:AMP-binding protein [Williamsia marianensis]PVY30204.1 fatty-acyl-CoA synthase [Williamsia marianensis]